MPETNCFLWMGDLESYMDEAFLKRACATMGETLRSVKMITNKVTGEPANYCFLEFASSSVAQQCLLKLNGKIIPGSQPPKMFKLNHAGYGREYAVGPEYSLFVKDLSEDVDDLKLFNSFSRLYSSCQGAKVVLDSSGKSRGFGFVRFAEESDQVKALIEMQNYKGLGSKPIRVAVANPKSSKANVANQYAHYMPAPAYGGAGAVWPHDPAAQQQDYAAAWAAWYAQTGTAAVSQEVGEEQQLVEEGGGEEEVDSDGETLIDPQITVDIDKENAEFMERSEELFIALENSRWHHLDNYLFPVTSS